MRTMVSPRTSGLARASDPRPVRWRLWLVTAAALLAPTVGGIVWAVSAEAESRQVHVMRTLAVGSLGLLAQLGWLCGWALFLSRLRWVARAAVIGLAAAAIGAAATTVRIRGVSGDVLPLVTWRWTDRAGDLARPAAPAGPSAAASPDAAPDYPQFLGVRRDATVPGARLARDARAGSPRRLWRQPIGAGWSGFAVAGGIAVTQEQRRDEELVTGYDLETGRLLWSHADRVRFEPVLVGIGPRATPAIRAGRVFAIGATGILNALDLASGERLWSVDVVADARSEVPEYGVSASPLAFDDVVVVAAGGRDGASLVAYDAASGRRRWSGGSDPAAYSSPMLVELAGVPQILLFNANHLSAHDPGDGHVLWQFPWPGETQRVSQPVVVPGDRVFVSSGYGIGGKLLQVRAGGEGGLAVELLWESRGLKAKFTNVVHRDGFLYGLDDGILACLDVESGQRRWKAGRYGHGQLILAGDVLVVLGESGDVALVAADPRAHVEVARFAGVAGTTWGHPALAGRLLLVRNDREAACYELAGAG